MIKIRLPFVLILTLCSFSFSQQRDSILLNVELDTLSNRLLVSQEFKLINHSPRTLTTIYLNAWINAYTGRLTELNKTKLEARKGALYFSTDEQRGSIEKTFFQNSAKQALKFNFEEREFIRLELKKPWKKGDTLSFKAFYEIKIPFDEVTKYGRSADGDYLIKYFFLQPAVMDKDGNWVLQHYKDFEEPIAYPTNYRLEFNYPENYELYSDLEEKGGFWEGNNIDFFRLYLTKHPDKIHIFKDEFSNQKIEFGFYIPDKDAVVVDSLIPSQLTFLKEHLGDLPTDKLFISSKTKKEQNYFGVDNLDIKISKLEPFTIEERNALKLFQVLSYEYIDQLFLTDKIKDHWLKNGLQYYLMMKYVDRYFSKLKLVGHLSDNFKIFGIRPINFFDAVKLKMNDRYRMLFLYVSIQSMDQPINTPFDEFSNLNQLVVSGFKTGYAFYYMDKFLGNGEFYKMIRDFSLEYRGQQINQLDFSNYLIEHSSQDLSWFFDDYIDKKDRINFKLITIDSEGDKLKVKIKNKTGFKGPFQLVGVKDGLAVRTEWLQNSENKFEVNFPAGDYDLIELNPDFIFPEIAERDNYILTHGMKKKQIRLYPDVENPKYSQIFVTPQLRWNNYDKFLPGLRFQNQSLIKRPFKWSLTPKWSTGQQSLTGSGLIQNTFLPQKGAFQFVRVGGAGQYEHYAKDLSYFKWSLFTLSEFKKNYRSNLSQGIMISYDHLNKQVPTGIVKTDEDKYGLFNLSYYYSKPDYIHEFRSSATFQTTDAFKKIFAEAQYRWRFAPKKQLGVRIFAGLFLENNSQTDYFNFGLSRVSDYAFNLNLLGRSESTGVLSQQFVLSEAGFKTYFEQGVNHWVTSMNLELPVWRMFDIYADVGFYDNKIIGTRFIYDSGIRVKIIPDFLEFYFPIQSTLGFEPSMSKYAQRIRYTITLNFGSLINHLRRGWY